MDSIQNRSSFLSLLNGIVVGILSVGKSEVFPSSLVGHTAASATFLDIISATKYDLGPHGLHLSGVDDMVDEIDVSELFVDDGMWFPRVTPAWDTTVGFDVDSVPRPTVFLGLML
jgi:hypothetical protein